MLDALDGTPVDVVQAHGTSTPLNDAVEAAALLDLCPGARVSSVKGALGHWVAGAGALGVLCAIDTLRTGRLFPTAGLEQPAFPLDFIGPGQTLEAKRVLVNAFAFGGANSSAVLERV